MTTETSNARGEVVAWADLPWRAAAGWLRSASGSKIMEVGTHEGCISQRESELIAAAVNSYATAPPAAARGDVRGLVGRWRDKDSLPPLPEAAYAQARVCADDLESALAAEGVQAGEVEQRARELLAAECGVSPTAFNYALPNATVSESTAIRTAPPPSQESAMDKPIPEAVAVTLHQDRAGCEWIIVTSKDHPDSESEVTPSDDPALFDLLKALTAAQQQGQAVACTCPSGDGSLRWPCPSHPPSAPVGVEGLVGALQSMRDRMMATLTPKFGDAFDGDFDTLLEAINAFKAGRGQNLEALAQQPAAVDEADTRRLDWLDECGHCADWDTGGCDVMRRVIRADDGEEFCADTWREAIDMALATQHQEPTT